MNDTGTKMTVLKLDVEGYEFRVLPNIISSHMIDFIEQMIIEIHSNGNNERSILDMNSIIQVVDKLELNGFTFVDYGPNLSRGRFLSTPTPYYSNFDVTFVKI